MKSQEQPKTSNNISLETVRHEKEVNQVCFAKSTYSMHYKKFSNIKQEISNNTTTSMPPPPPPPPVSFKTKTTNFKAAALTENGEDSLKQIIIRSTEPVVLYSKIPIPLPPPPSLMTQTFESSAKKAEINALEQNPTIIVSDANLEEEVLSLQVLSARSSTPYTQPMSSCSSVSCDLEHSGRVSPVKDGDHHHLHNGNHRDQTLEGTLEESQQQKRHVLSISKSAPVITNSSNYLPRKIAKSKSSHITGSDNTLHYSRSTLFHIRNEMSNAKNIRQHSTSVPPNIVNCDVIELEARLRRLNILRLLESHSSRNYNTLKGRSNDMMPAFFKRKIATLNDESIIKSHPAQPEYKVSSSKYDS